MRDAEQWGGVQSVCERRVGQGRRGREGLMGEVPVLLIWVQGHFCAQIASGDR